MPGRVWMGTSYILTTTVEEDIMYPVGAIFESIVGTDPATQLGYGTWAAFGAGRVIVGYDSGDGDFDTAEKTGGAKTVQASAQTFGGDALATHQHAAITAGTPAGTNNAPAFTGSTTTTDQAGVGATQRGTTSSTLTLKAHTHTLTPLGTVAAPAFTGSPLATHQHDAITAGTPSGTNTPGAATSVVQSFIVAYRWVRTA
jgi:hypothetical protein